jgi:hypothetical protein
MVGCDRGGMTSTKEWARRVGQWRASGKSSEEFAAGKGFTGGGLRYWAHRLKLEAEGAASSAPAACGTKQETSRATAQRAVRVARVIRSSPGAAAVAARVDGTIVFDFAGARVAVEANYDRAALRDLLALLGEAGDELARRRSR